MNYDFSIIREPQEFREIEKDWEKFIGDGWNNHPFLRHFWFSNYHQAFHKTDPLMILTASVDSRLVAALPMLSRHRRLGGIPLKEVRLIAGDHSHINIVPVPQDRDEILVSFLETLLSSGVDLIYLEDIKSGFPDNDWLARFCHDRKLGFEMRQVRTSLYIPTDGEFESYRLGRSKNLKQGINSRLNRIYRAGGFEIKTFSSNDDIELALSDAKEVCDQSWQGIGGTGLFSSVSNAQFYTELFRDALKNRYGTLYVLYFEKQPAAFEFHIVHEETEFCLKAAYAKKFDKVAPGAVLDIELIKKAFDSPVKKYDLLGYDDLYKRRWTDQSVSYWRYFIFNKTAAGQTARLIYFNWGDKLRKIKRRLAKGKN